MKDSANENFENAWKEQFKEASIEPDEKVWAKIDAYLANSETSVYKKRILFFQLLAAASLIFAIGIGYYNFYLKETTNSTLSLGPVNDNNDFSKGNPPSLSPNFNTATNQSNKKELSSKISRQKPKNENILVRLTRENKGEIQSGQISQQPLVELVNSFSLILNHMELPAIEKPYVPRYPGFKAIDRIDIEKSDIANKKQQMWAGIDMASGVFNPNISYGARSSFFNFGGKSTDMASVPGSMGSAGNSYYDPEKSSFSPKISFSYGVIMGYKIARKWIVNGGFGYQLARSSTSVTKYTESTSQSERYAYSSFAQNIKNADGIMSINTSSTSIDLNSDFEFFTFPVTTGFIVIDKKLKWTLNGGLETDILIKNTLYNPDNFLRSVEFKPGKDSPYKSTMFTGIIGTNVYLPLFKNYQISLFPTYRFGFNYMTKESSVFNSKPSSFMLSAGIAYIFK